MSTSYIRGQELSSIETRNDSSTTETFIEQLTIDSGPVCIARKILNGLAGRGFGQGRHGLEGGRVEREVVHDPAHFDLTRET